MIHTPRHSTLAPGRMFRPSERVAERKRDAKASGLQDVSCIRDARAYDYRLMCRPALLDVSPRRQASPD